MWTMTAFHNKNDITTPKPTPTKMMPNLCNCMATEPTNAPNNTEIIIAIHKQNELVEDSNNSLNTKSENRNPHK